MDEPTQPESGGQEEVVAQQLERVVERYRTLLIAANPDVVPELVQGADTEELDRSLEVARAAFARAREAARAELASSPTPTNPLRRDTPPVGLESAGPLAKIAWGLRDAQA
ncbi:MAG: hypothetical protein M3P51_10185 [Chloroflexota bacterium]|nr:hypothetical protein [Chloroflexota bacterium]